MASNDIIISIGILGITALVILLLLMIYYSKPRKTNLKTWSICWKLDRFIFNVYQFVNKFQRGIMIFLGGYLLKGLLDELSIEHENWLDFLKSFLRVNHPYANFLMSLLISFLVIVPIGNRILAKYYRRRRYEKIFASLVRRFVSPPIAKYHHLAWGSSLSLQTCPELHRGWRAADVRVYHNSTLFSVPNEVKETYQKYLEMHYQDKRFFDDNKKVMLTRNPTAFSDSPTLILETKEALFSQSMFYVDNIATSTSKRDEFIRKVVDECLVLFPHTLCMHAIIVTKDDKVLITKRSPKVAYYPGTWSCSIEEQLSLSDIKDGGDRAVLKWFKRLLHEELGLSAEAYNEENLRILSVFLESDILNISVCAHAILDMDSVELGQVLKCLPRTDYEFTDWAFLKHEDLFNELFNPSRAYHPTSGYRMLMALIRRYGEPKIAEKFFSKK